jgi:phage terminase large subunit-like protein
MMLEQSLYIPGLEKGIKPRQKKSERLLSLVAPLARGEFFFRSTDIHAQQEFLSYPRGKHDDILDAVYYAIDGVKPCRQKDYMGEEMMNKPKKILDWLTM